MAKINPSEQCPYTLERCIAECKEVLEANGHTLTVPVEYSRAQKILAYVRCGWRDSRLVPVKVCFSYAFFRMTDEYQCRQVLLHEMAHYIVIERTCEKHGHDAYFKAVCREIGADDFAGNAQFHVDTDPEWEIYCPTCGRRLGSGFGPTVRTQKLLKRKISRCCRVTPAVRNLETEDLLTVHVSRGSN